MNSPSNGEIYIISYLQQRHIPFIREKQFSDCRNGKLRYDFYIPSQGILIEYNGEQHYKYTSFFYKTKSDWTKAQERDRQKISYALAHGYTMYCIPYWIDLSTKPNIFDIQFKVSSKFHNDLKYREYQISQRV